MSEISYESLRSGEATLPSWLCLLLAADLEEPTISTVNAALERAYGDRLLKMVPSDAPVGSWLADIEIQEEEGVVAYRAWLEYTEDLHELHYLKPGFTDEALEQIKVCRRTLKVETTYGDDVITDFHQHVKFLCALEVDFIAVLDAEACVLRTAEWIRFNASNRTPPPPESLFTVHCVHDEDGQAWLHTHGMLRCGCIEWEILGGEGANSETLYGLVNTVACASISNPFPEEGEEFEQMLGLPTVWLPYEKAIGKFSKKILGGREDRDEWHSHPSGVLLLKTKFLHFFTRYRSVNEIAPEIAGRPLMFISNAETSRMISLATERFADFRHHFGSLGDNDDFMFIIKLGYTVDHAEDEFDREHMWFAVLSVDEQRVEGELLNQPFNIARMNEGDRDWHSLDLLTDWQIMSVLGTFSPSHLPSFEVELNKYHSRE
jgi:hypothetical protein